MLKVLKKENKIFVGLKDTEKAITKEVESEIAGKNESKLIVFVINNPETLTLNKHIISSCKQFGVKHLVLPKF